MTSILASTLASTPASTSESTGTPPSTSSPARPATPPAGAPAARWRIGLWVAAGIALLLAAAGLGFRQPWSLDAARLAGWEGIRVLGLFAAGALVAGGAWRRAAPAHEPLLLAVAMGGAALAAAAAGRVLPDGMALPAALAGAAPALYLWLGPWRDGPPRGGALLAVGVLLGLAAAGALVGALALTGSSTAPAAWIVRWLGGAPDRVAVLPGAAVALLLWVTGSALRGGAGGVLMTLAGLALVGPLAFLGWWARTLGGRVFAGSGAAQAWLCGAVGGITLVTVDAVQRALIGGYAPAPGFALLLVGLPAWLWQASRDGGRGVRTGGAVLVVLLVAGIGAFTLFATALIRGAT